MGWKEIRKVSDLDFDSKINKKSIKHIDIDSTIIIKNFIGHKMN